MELRTKIIVYGGGGVILIAIIFALLGSRGSPQVANVSTGVDSNIIAAQLQAQQQALASDAQIANATIAANAQTTAALAVRDVSLADIAANREVALDDITARSAIDGQSISRQYELGIATLGADIRIAENESANDLETARVYSNGANDLARIQANIDVSAINAQAARDAAIIGNIGLVKKKSRDEVLQTLISGQNTQRFEPAPSKTAQVIGAAGGAIKSVASIFG